MANILAHWDRQQRSYNLELVSTITHDHVSRPEWTAMTCFNTELMSIKRQSTGVEEHRVRLARLHYYIGRLLVKRGLDNNSI